MWTCTGLDPDARVAVSAGGVNGKVELSLDSSTCSLTLGHLELSEALAVLLALDEDRLAEALAALLAVPTASKMAAWRDPLRAAEYFLTAFVAQLPPGTDGPSDALLAVVAGCVRGTQRSVLVAATSR